MFFLQVGVEHDDPAGEERERQLGAGGLDLGHWHRSGSQVKYYRLRGFLHLGSLVVKLL